MAFESSKMPASLPERCCGPGTHRLWEHKQMSGPTVAIWKIKMILPTNEDLGGALSWPNEFIYVKNA
jgi:hypothetical protein